jgi:hypothetical protein
MSRFKDIEHDGFEFFGKDDRPDRKRVKFIEKELAETVNKNQDEVKKQAQEKYMSVENPLLWEGDSNDD